MIEKRKYLLSLHRKYPRTPMAVPLRTRLSEVPAPPLLPLQRCGLPSIYSGIFVDRIRILIEPIAIRATILVKTRNAPKLSGHTL
jgi:hypothetical protein